MGGNQSAKMESEREPELVSNVKCLLAALLRMHMGHQRQMFWNRTREFKIMLRNDPIDQDTLAFEILLVDDADEDESEGGILATLLELDADVWVGEEGEYVVENYAFDREEAVRDPDVLQNARAMINRVWDAAPCPCGKHLIKDGAPMCLFCQMTEDRLDSSTHQCAICSEAGVEVNMHVQECCKNRLHMFCLAKWHATQREPTCPLCRAPKDPGSPQNQVHKGE